MQTHTNSQDSAAIPHQREVVTSSLVNESEVVVIAEESEQALQAEIVDDKSAPPSSWLFRGANWIGGIVEWLFGGLCMLIGLAIVAAIPVVQLLSLGYLLEASGRIARTGRLRSGFFGMRKAARIGSIALGVWVCLLPVQFASSTWYQSNLIEPESDVTQGLRVLQLVVTVLMVCHIVAACYCGGRLRHFFWPLIAPFSMTMWILRWAASRPALRKLLDYTLGLFSKNLVNDICNWKPLSDWFLPAVLVKGLVHRELYTRARDDVWNFLVSLKLPELFWLGLRGFIGGVAWLAIPVLLLIGGTTLGQGSGGGLLLLIGGILLAIVVAYLPFLQAHFAAENRLRAVFEWRRIRETFRRAPLEFLIALLFTLALAIPPYVFKIVPFSNIGATENELNWLACLVFVAFIFPTRLLCGWAVGRGRHRPQRAHWLFRWLARPGMVPITLIYVLLAFVTQYVSWHGKWSLLEQHIFLVPSPFLGW